MPQKHRSYLYSKFLDGEIPNQDDFQDTIDSAFNKLDDGITSYQFDTPAGTKKWVGINETVPKCLLTIKGDAVGSDELICLESTDGAQSWNINLNPTNINVPGFSIDDGSTGISNSRLFIDLTGKVGIGTVAPMEQLHVQSNNDGGGVSVMITNLATTHDGFKLTVIDDNAVPDRIGAFGLLEKEGISTLERLTVLPKITTPTNTYLFTGINEPHPTATLQITRSQADPQSNIALAENTGILVVGPTIGLNLGIDSHEIQARDAEYVPGSTVINVTASTLNIQPLGGDTIFQSGSAIASQTIISANGKVGLGKTPIERLDLNATDGAITFGDTSTASPAEGTVRWHPGNTITPSDLQVFKNGSWTSLTTVKTVTDTIWSTGAVAGTIFYAPIKPADARVGINVTNPSCALTVDELFTTFAGTARTALITSEAATTSSDVNQTRIGLEINTSGTWSTNPAANNVGLYIGNVTGQTNVNANIGAVINSNVVIGNLNGHSLVGDSGTNIFAIQDGNAPQGAPGVTTNSGIQIFSNAQTGTTVSVFNVMNGDGTTIQLFRQGPIQPANDLTVPATGDANTNALIDHMRSRINDLEAKLIALGLLIPHP